jgi:Rod binding domain-containing protein
MSFPILPSTNRLRTVPESTDRPSARNTLEAAQQFEALLIGQLLKATHEEGSSGWMGSGEDAAGSQAIAFAEDALARVLAAQGGLGLAQQIVKQLSPKAASSTPTVTPPSF